MLYIYTIFYFYSKTNKFLYLERWPSGRKRRIANPLYKLFVPRVRIPLSPFKNEMFYSLRPGLRPGSLDKNPKTKRETKKITTV